jgi:hypothetical protein
LKAEVVGAGAGAGAGAAELEVDGLVAVGLLDVDVDMDVEEASEVDEDGMTGALTMGKEEEEAVGMIKDSKVFDSAAVEDEDDEVIVVAPGVIVEETIPIDVGTAELAAVVLAALAMVLVLPAPVLVVTALHALFPFKPLFPLIPLLLKCLFNTSTSGTPRPPSTRPST